MEPAFNSEEYLNDSLKGITWVIKLYAPIQLLYEKVKEKGLVWKNPLVRSTLDAPIGNLLGIELVWEQKLDFGLLFDISGSVIAKRYHRFTTEYFRVGWYNDEENTMWVDRAVEMYGQCIET